MISKKQHILFIALLAIFVLPITGCSFGESKKDKEAFHQEEEDTSEGDPFAAPEKWQEHWFEHKQLVHLVYSDEHLALYFDKDVDQSIQWPKAYLGKVWKYIKSVYGEFGEDPKLYAILHTGKYSGGHPSPYMDASHDFRNVVDCGPYTWLEPSPEEGLSMMIHEIGHIVEGAANGIKENPAWDIWKDSKWAEIFIYDVYRNTGQEEYAEYTFNNLMEQVDDYPRPGTQWFKDWFYPIYTEYGGNKVLNRFYELLALHFPKNAEGNRYTRRMNMGEFVHFWSGAAAADLQPLAENAFGWPEEWNTQLKEAKSTFYNINY